MTVLYVIDTLVTGGAEKSLLEISSRLKEFKPVVCVVLAKNSDLKKDFIARGIQLIELKVQSKLWWIEGARKLKAVVREIKPDIVHATLFKAEIITRIALRNSSIPQVGSFVNDSYSIERFRSLGRLMRLKLKTVQWIDRITGRNVDHFMSITHAIVSTNKRALRLDSEKITVIHRGRDLQKLLAAVDKSKFESLHLEYQGKIVFLTVARLLKRKGYVESISAFARVVKQYPNAHYLVAGEGHDRAHFEQLIRDLGVENHVTLLGTRGDVPNLLTFADYFIFPSHYEGQGGALVEAMLFGKPIIATDIPVFQEQIQHGLSARLFKLRDVNDLYDQIVWMIEHGEAAKILGVRAKEYALNAFDIQNVARQHEELYKKVIREKDKNIL